jgi:hypothetical protein
VVFPEIIEVLAMESRTTVLVAGVKVPVLDQLPWRVIVEVFPRRVPPVRIDILPVVTA